MSTITTCQVLPFAAIPHSLAEDSRLKPIDVVLVRALAKLAKTAREILASNSVLTRLVKRCLRTVQASLARLEAAGWIGRGFSPGGRTIILHWIHPQQRISPVAGGAINCAPPTVVNSVLREESNTAANTESHCLLAAAAGDPSTPEPTPKPPVEERRKATAEDLERVAAAAAAIFPELPNPMASVLALAKTRRRDGEFVGVQWVEWALDWAVHAKARVWGFVVTKINQWIADGVSCGPPPKPRSAPALVPTPPPPPKTEDVPLSEDERREMESIANGRGPAARLARIRLDIEQKRAS